MTALNMRPLVIFALGAVLSPFIFVGAAAALVYFGLAEGWYCVGRLLDWLRDR